MKGHSKKLIAPIIITAILILYLAAFIVVSLLVPLPWYVKLLGIMIPLAFIGVGIFVLIERIKEIRSGEEDDLDKY